MKSLIKKETAFHVAIKEGDELVEVAIVDCADRAKVFCDTLQSVGMVAVHYKEVVE